MKRTLSLVREASPFATPPRVLVVADDAAASEALELVEALDEFGAEAEVRLSGYVSDDLHNPPDAVIFASTPGSQRAPSGSVRIGVTNSEGAGSGFDLVVSRPVNASALMEQLGDYLPRIKM
jgi:hypothetical protein